ncbi:hypothetical protein CEUSTIGMA_g7288.t1 [Chlamydomonas eustigma]|uniref:tRNA (guanine(10)-N(2))-methyltransferase n=1 Tax=Chlamydomonas eustigma TaxID=1157962 RepID=A0A250X9U3_9CHLO|nr:hypothetical protein CEUSTIGMA_g7288.t1 [Chlamydomonas eustigma]|eukprot:GAX79848.1 hypothetical protein CEUSTIGMA_g7288.t1 [Chlamydomonas eustigma]
MRGAEVLRNPGRVLRNEGGSSWYMCYFLHRLLDFRVPDVESVISMLGYTLDLVQWQLPHGNEPFSPFWYLRLPNIELPRLIADRAMLTKGFMEVWGEGSTWEELQESIEACPAAIKDPWLKEDIKFKIVIETYGWKLGDENHKDCIQKLQFIPFQGSVDLKHADVKMWLILCKTSDNSGIPDTVPDRMYFGREVSCSDRSRVDAYALKKRRYIGPTSMDTEMAFIMANMGKVQKGNMVLDPYAGTGSILVAAAAFGAQVMGADIDVRVIKVGKLDDQGQQLDVYSNFQQYSLTPRLAGLLRMDVHMHSLRPGLEEAFHAIIGDPPYGVRAGGRKSMPKPGIEIRNRENHIIATAPYTLGECLRDLLDLAARLLVVGGRLVYFFPSAPETYREDEIPAHPALQLVYNVEQILTTRYSRRLIVMEKAEKYDAKKASDHHLSLGEPMLSIDRLHDQVYEQRPGKECTPSVFDKKSNDYQDSTKRFRSKLV